MTGGGSSEVVEVADAEGEESPRGDASVGEVDKANLDTKSTLISAPIDSPPPQPPLPGQPAGAPALPAAAGEAGAVELGDTSPEPAAGKGPLTSPAPSPSWRARLSVWRGRFRPSAAASSLAGTKRVQHCSVPCCGDGAWPLWLEYLYYHPWCRIFIATSISGCNFWIYAEDPVAHSWSQAELPVVGPAWELLFMRYSSGWRAPVKIVLWMIFLWLGIIIGRNVVHHCFLRDFLKLSMFGWEFTDEDDILPRSTKHDAGDKVCPLRCYWPFAAGGQTTWNRIFWWQRDLRETVGTRYDYVTASSHRPPENMTYYQLNCAREARVEEGWADREKYQGGFDGREPAQTAVEVWCPRFCHPKKHRSATKGSWMVMFATSVLSLFVASQLWNAIFLAGVDDEQLDKLELGDGLGMRNRVFMKLAATGTWFGDFFTAIMVIDGMLQELGKHLRAIRDSGMADPDLAVVLHRHRTHRPGKLRRMLKEHPEELGDDAARDGLDQVIKCLKDPARRLKLGYLNAPGLINLGLCWEKRCGPVSVRVFVVLFTAFALTLLVVIGFYGDVFLWDKWMQGVNGTNEAQRALLAAVITGMDLIIVMHDWEFPGFDSAQDIKFPGVEITDCDCGYFALRVAQVGRDGEAVAGAAAGAAAVGRRVETRNRVSCCRVFATGKWFNYGIIFLVMGLDLNMLKNQLIYIPGAFGQYVRPDDLSRCDTAEKQRADPEFCQTGVICWIPNRERADDLTALWKLAEPGPAGGPPVHPFEFSYARLGEDGNCMPSRYNMVPTAVLFAAALPAIVGAVWFAAWVAIYSRHDERIRKHEEARGAAGDRWFGKRRH